VAEPITRYLPDNGATSRLGAALARAVLDAAPPRLVIYLDGELGAGKTALTRAVLAGLGHTGRVPSPTYTLVEPYLLNSFRVFHIDLYRLRDPAELDDLGLADELGPGSLLLAEWPSRGDGRLPPADLVCQLGFEGEGRRALLTSLTGEGARVLVQLDQILPAEC
jgi:tRNA threonylcarbamoyladenosine biosynthesis protein TsaE